MILLVTSAPVNAGWLDSLFKGFFKSSKIAKKEEKVVNNVVKEDEEKEAQRLVKQGEKKEVKQLTKEEQIAKNRKAGIGLERAFIDKWCQDRICANSVDELGKFTKEGNQKYYITSDRGANEWIRKQKFDEGFTRLPDMLEIESYSKGYLKSFTIYDVKTSEEAIAAAKSRGQIDDYVKLCNDQNKKFGREICKVKYVLPKEEAEELAKKSGNSILGCLAIGIIIAGPDPTDLLCFVGS